MLFLWRVVVILVALKSLILEFVCLFLSFFWAHRGLGWRVDFATIFSSWLNESTQATLQVFRFEQIINWELTLPNLALQI
jgi:hypothetical protein